MKITKFGVITQAEDGIIETSGFKYEAEEGDEFGSLRTLLQAIADFDRDQSPQGQDLVVLRREDYERSIY